MATFPHMILTRIRNTRRELALFAITTMVMGASFSMVDSIFNNFLDETFSLTGFQRSFLEFPRELPGFLVVFVSALLAFLCTRRLGMVAMLLAAVGAFLIGNASTSYSVMIVWLFAYSLGNHLFMPLSASIGMELAPERQAGRRLGQLNALRNFAMIGGSGLIIVGFKYFHFTFQTAFTLTAVGLLIAAVLMSMMKPEKDHTPKTYLKLHREYRLYYAMAVLSGSRKQIFLTFAPWVLVTIFNQPTQIIATLLTAGGVIGILFQPFLGWAVDRFGERKVLAADAVVMIFICLGYGFTRSVLPEGPALIVMCVCFVADQMMFAVGMARSTYIKKIAKQPEDIQPALAAGVTIDHVFSISAALVGGVIWSKFGFQYVFLFGVGIALLNLLAALQVKVRPAPENLAASASGSAD